MGQAPEWVWLFLGTTTVGVIGFFIRYVNRQKDEQFKDLDKRVSKLEQNALLRAEFQEEMRYIRSQLDNISGIEAKIDTIRDVMVNGR